MSTEESPSTVVPQYLIGLVLAVFMVLGAYYLIDAWNSVGGTDKRMLSEVGVLGEGIINAHGSFFEITTTRIEGYFFIYCMDPSEPGCGEVGAETYGARDAIIYQCEDHCLCVAKLPKKENSNYLSNIVGCVRLMEIDSDGEEVTYGFANEDDVSDNFRVFPKYGCCTNYFDDNVADTFRYRDFELSKLAQGDADTGCLVRVEDDPAYSDYLGSTRSEESWDEDGDDWVDLCGDKPDGIC